ncbi:MAG: methyltransferase domain-containing protein [Deltaproteobacteria bacterium]|nr:methyltransferase domain-containing protein [Deltaproteobacteria bacterium]
MGTSRSYYLTNFSEYIIKNQPRRVLDLGVGFGKNGFLVREYTDIWLWRYRKEEWETIIDGIEIYEPNINPCNQYIYDDIFIGDIKILLPSMGEYDLIVMTDVLEHFEKKDAERVMKEIKAHSTEFFVTTPVRVGNRVFKKGNVHESHISGEWNLAELEQFGQVKVLQDHTYQITSF